MYKINSFIENFKKGFDNKYLEEVFTKGNCYHFALILEGMYDGDIIYDPHNQHFSFLHDGSFYDITGEIKEPMDYQLWEEMVDNNSIETQEIVKHCVYKI